MVRSLTELDERLRGLGGRFAVAPPDQELFQERLVHFLREAPYPPPVIPVFRTVAADDRLEDNIHFGPRLNRAFAWRLARWLLERGWIDGGRPGALPPEDRRYRGDHAAFPEGEAMRARQEEIEALALRHFQPSISFETAEGLEQVYGGLEPDGVVGTGLFAALRGPGDTLRFAGRRPPDVHGLYPLELTFRINGVPAGTRPIEAEGPEEFELLVPVPPAAADAPYLDVLVTASNWAHGLHQGIEGQRSVRFRVLELD